MAYAIDFSDLAPAPPSAAAQPPPVQPQQPASNAYFGPGGPQGAAPTQAQENYARAANQPSGARGSGSNPYYDTPGGQAPQGAAVVTAGGQLSDPGGQINPNPGGGHVLDFSDLAPQVNPWTDAAKSIPTALVHGATSVVGLAGNIGDMTDAAVQGVANGVRGLFGQGPVKLAHGHRIGGLDIPDSADLNREVSAVAGPLYQPQTWAGRAVDTAGQFAPAAFLGPEGLAPKAASVVIPWLTSDAAGEAARTSAHPQWEAPARLAGGVLGGLGTAAASGAPISAKVITAGAEGLTPQDIQAATALRQSSEGLGVPLTLPEGVAQAAPGKGGAFLAAQRAVEGTPTGGRVFAPMMQARPTQMQGAVGRYVDQVGTPTTSPSAVAPQASAAAQGALGAERDAINARAAPLYAASRTDLVDPAAYSPLEADPSYKAALAAVRNDPERAHLIAGLPDNSVGVIDEAAKRLSTLADQAAGTPMAPGDLHLAGLRQSAADRAFNVAAASSPTYGAARQMVAQGHATTLTPLTAGPLGQVAAARTVPAQTGAMFPTAPYPGAPVETAEALTRMGLQNPASPGALVRAHLGQAAAEAFSDTRAGPNLYAGAKLGLDLAGNPIQAQNLNAGISAAAGSNTAAQLDPLVQALMATGKRLPTRAATPEELGAALKANPINASELGIAAGVASEAVHNPIGALGYIPLKIGTKAIDAIGKARTQAEVQKLADQLTAPASDTAAIIDAARRRGQVSPQMLGAAVAGTGLAGGRN